LVVSLGLDTFGGDPISDLALTADGFERCGAAVMSAGLPTVVLQEGGYADAQLGENARAWLVGAMA
jgi:acetoin utilization deacetylase AcuC-like enzyme